jgi:hypothetical protein
MWHAERQKGCIQRFGGEIWWKETILKTRQVRQGSIKHISKKWDIEALTGVMWLK